MKTYSYVIHSQELQIREAKVTNFLDFGKRLGAYLLNAH